MSLCLVFVATFVSCGSAEEFSLRLRAPESTSFKSEIDLSIVNRFGQDTTSISAKLELLQGTDPQPSGLAMRTYYERIRAEILVPGMSGTSYDSDFPEKARGGLAGQLHNSFGPLVHRESKDYYDSLGHPMDSIVGGVVTSSQTFSDEDFRMIYPTFPADAIRIGAKWSDEVIGGNGYHSSRTWKLDEVNGERARLTLKGKVSNSGTAGSIQMQGQLSGYCIVDRETGQTFEALIVQTLDSEGTVQGQPVAFITEISWKYQRLASK